MLIESKSMEGASMDHIALYFTSRPVSLRVSRSRVLESSKEKDEASIKLTNFAISRERECKLR